MYRRQSFLWYTANYAAQFSSALHSVVGSVYDDINSCTEDGEEKEKNVVEVIDAVECVARTTLCVSHALALKLGHGPLPKMKEK